MDRGWAIFARQLFCLIGSKIARQEQQTSLKLNYCEHHRRSFKTSQENKRSNKDQQGDITSKWNLQAKTPCCGTVGKFGTQDPATTHFAQLKILHLSADHAWHQCHPVFTHSLDATPSQSKNYPRDFTGRS